MEEKNKKIIKFLNILSGLFLIIFSVIFVIISSRDAETLPDQLCYGINIFGFVVFSFLIISAFLQLLVILLIIKNHFPLKNHLWKAANFLFIIFILTFLAIIFTVSPCCSRTKAREARKNADLRQIATAQEMFYDDNFYNNNSRYAISQQELVDAGYFETILTDPDTKKEYTDKDGVGLEGGDEDPNTWFVQAIRETNINEVCSKKKPVYIFLCDQEGCREERYIRTER